MITNVELIQRLEKVESKLAMASVCNRVLDDPSSEFTLSQEECTEILTTLIMAKHRISENN